MREIKFRVWNWKKILSWDIIKQLKTVLLSKILEGKHLEYIPMQYTWLKDKNWKEIYEGDLIQYDWNSRVWEVYFDEDRLQYRIRCKGKARPDDKDTMKISYSLEWLELTGVGNIYEDKHLLNN